MMQNGQFRKWKLPASHLMQHQTLKPLAKPATEWVVEL